MLVSPTSMEKMVRHRSPSMTSYEESNERHAEPAKKRHKRGRKNSDSQFASLPSWGQDVANKAMPEPLQNNQDALRASHKLMKVLQRIIREKNELKEEQDRNKSRGSKAQRKQQTRYERAGERRRRD